MEEKMFTTETAEQETNSVQPVSRPKSRKLSFDADGNLHTNNLSAFWIPEMTVMEVIHGTTYIVTGSYEGKESFVPKLERILVRNSLQESDAADSNDEGKENCDQEDD